MIRYALVAAIVVLALLALALWMRGVFMLIFIIFGGAFIIGAPIVSLLRLVPAYRRSVQAQAAVQAAKEEPLAAYQAAGWSVARAFPGAKRVVRGVHAGVAFRYYIEPEDGPGASVVSIDVDAPGEFAVKPEDTGTGLAHTFGMASEFRTGDAALDRQRYFSGTTDEYLRAVFTDPSNLPLWRALFNDNWLRIEKDAVRLTAFRPGPDYLPVDSLKAVVEKLSALRLPRAVEGGTQQRFLGRQGLYIVRAAVILLCLVGFMGFYATRPLVDGAVYFFFVVSPLALALLGAIVAGAYFMLKGQSMAMASMGELIFYLPLVAVALIGVLRLANERLDMSEADNREVRLLKAFTTPGNEGASNRHLQFESWRGRMYEEYQVDGDTYALAKADRAQLWQFRLRQGALGYGWIEAMQPAANH